MRTKADIERLHDRVARLIHAPMFEALNLEPNVRSDVLTMGVLLCWVLDHRGGDRPMRRFERILEEVERQVESAQAQIRGAVEKARDSGGHAVFGQAEAEVVNPLLMKLAFDTEEFNRRDHLLKAQTHAGNVGNPSLN